MKIKASTKTQYSVAIGAGVMVIFVAALVSNSFASASSVPQDSGITPDQAIKAAADYLSVQSSDFKSVELGTLNGHQVYSVEIMKGYEQLDVQVDSVDGKIILVELDSDSNQQTDNSVEGPDGDGDGETADD